MLRDKILKSLKEQLAAKGKIPSHYADLLNDYMTFWDMKNALSKDIDVRGVVFKDKSSVGVEMWKNNPSVKELVMINRQMLAILKELKIQTDNYAPGADGNDL